MTDVSKDYIEEIVEQYEASSDELDHYNRLRYAMARSMCYGKDVNTPDMKKILMTLVAPEHQTASQLKSKLVRLFVFANLTGSELSYDIAKKVYNEKFKMPFGESEG